LATKVIMPALGMVQETGKLIAWLKQEGDKIAKGEPVIEIETDKTTVEIEATASGILGGVSAQEGDDIPVGKTIAWILSSGETIPEQVSTTSVVEEPTSLDSMDEIRTATPVAQKIAADHGIDLHKVRPAGRRIQKADVLAFLETEEVKVQSARLAPASPKARRLAHERDIDVSKVPGSGPENAVLSADVLAYGEDSSNSQAVSLSTVWKRMTERVTHSWTTTPHFYLLREVNTSSLIAWRNYVSESTGKRVTYTDLLLKLVAAALRKHPRVNAYWKDGEILLNKAINIGIAVAVEEGLVVPVIHKADQLSLSQIADRRQELVSRSHDRKLLLEDLQEGTFTISNLGMYGVDIFNAIINPPQAAILAVGRIHDRVVAVDGQAVVQPMMYLSLAYDHRVVDGARGAQFLETIAGFIEEPFRLVD